MSTLLVVQSYGGAYEQVRRQWPHFMLPGWDICGCCPEDDHHPWPPDIRYCELIGKSAYLSPELVKTWVKTWETLLFRDCYKKYDDFCMIEYDAVFLQQPPPHPGGAFLHLTGGAIGGVFKATKFFHNPHWLDRAAAAIVVEEGNKMLSEGEFEGGSPDVFMGRITDRRPDLKWTESNTFSVNGNDLMNRGPQAAEAIRNGVWFLHGLRTQEELDWILSQRP